MDHFLFKAIILSLAVHLILVCSTLITHRDNLPLKKPIKTIEITYEPRQKALDIKQHPVKSIQHLDLTSATGNANESIPFTLIKDQTARPFSMYERKSTKIQSIQMTRRVSVAPIKSEKINNPAYAAYSDMVRSRIEEKVNLNYDKIGVGNVYLTFILDNAGNLKAAQIMPEQTNASEHLQNISLQSLNQASVFPAFLKGMTLPEYTFNIEIQYQFHDQ